jgi:hypothetical protein
LTKKFIDEENPSEEESQIISSQPSLASLIFPLFEEGGYRGEIFGIIKI